MNVATVLAIAAAIAAAAGLTDLVDARRRRPRRRGATLRLVTHLGASLGFKPSGGLAARVAAAGLDRPTSEIVALQTGLALLCTLAAIAMATVAPGRLGLALLLAAPVAGFLAPEYALRGRARTRARVMEAELADVLDLMRVAIGAGLAPRRALAEVGRRHPGLLAKELTRAANRANMGEPAERALEQLEARCPATGIAPLAAALRRAERHGAPLSTTLAAQALQARSLRAAKRSEHAAKAAPKIQLVVALLLVPAVLLLVAAALVPALTPIPPTSSPTGAGRTAEPAIERANAGNASAGAGRAHNCTNPSHIVFPRKRATFPRPDRLDEDRVGRKTGSVLQSGAMWGTLPLAKPFPGGGAPPTPPPGID
jgi:tight adherence protein C